MSQALCAEIFACIISLDPHNNPTRKYYFHLHITGREGEVEETVSEWPDWDLGPGQSDSKATLTCSATQQGGGEAGIPDPGTSAKLEQKFSSC